DGRVTALIIIGCNPVYDAPADLNFRDLMADTRSKIKFRVHLGLYADETARFCHWHVPAAHYLESWGDIRAYDGTVSLIQPLIAPLYDGRTEIELIAAMLGAADRSAYDLVCEHWKSAGLGPNVEEGWQKALHDGMIADTASKPLQVRVRGGL